LTERPAVPSARPLASRPFFQGLDPAFLATLESGVSVVSFAAGAEVVREGSPATAFFLIEEGKVALEIASPDRPRRTILTLGPGDVLGWSWLVAPYRWRLDAHAVKPTVVTAVNATVLRAALEADPAQGYRLLLRLLPIIASRLESTRLQLLDLHAP
jgi:CRP/FNR family transcriptional regulator, cyclic AMP receptor protein